MIILLWVFGFFTMLSLLVGQCRENFCILDLYTDSFVKKEAGRFDKQQKSIQDCFDSLIATVPRRSERGMRAGIERSRPQPPSKAKIYLDVVPHSSRFNMAVLFKGGEDLYKTGLLRHLRSRCGEAADLLIAEIVQKGQWVRATTKNLDPTKVALTSLNDLAKIPLVDRPVIYKLLKEGLNQSCLFESDRNKYALSVHYASEELLTALLDNSLLAHAIVTLRTERYRLGERVLNSNKKTRVSDEYIKEADLTTLFKEHGLEYDKYRAVLEVAVRVPTRDDLPHDAHVPKEA